MNTHTSNTALIAIQSLQPLSLEWLWPGYLPRGKLALLDGDPGCGKSLLTIDFAARLSSGRPLPNDAPPSAIVRCLFLNAEDGLADTLLPRLQAAGADLGQVMCMMGAERGSGSVQFPRDFKELESFIAAEQIGLVVIDPLAAFMPMPSIRKPLAALAAIAERQQATILLVRHLAKSQKRQALYRGTGSVDIIAAVRSALLAGRHPRNAGFGILAACKNNLDVSAPSLCYEPVSKEGSTALAWHGPFGMSADDLVAVQGKRVPPGVLRAGDWLMRYLAEGPRHALDVVSAAAADDISETTLARAKKQLGIASKLESVNGRAGWLWMLPTPRPQTLKEKMDEDLMKLMQFVYPNES